eukprot:925812_1
MNLPHMYNHLDHLYLFVNHRVFVSMDLNYLICVVVILTQGCVTTKLIHRRLYQDTSLNGSKCGLSQSDTHSRNQGFECNDPYPSYPMANNIETPQPLPYFPLRQSPTFSTFYTRTCSQAPRPQSQDTYHVYTTRNAHYHHDW